MEIISNVGQGWIQNYSKMGLGIQLDTFLSRGFTFDFELNISKCDDFRHEARARNYFPLHGEVRWSQIETGHYSHGIRIIGISDEAARWLLAWLARIPHKSRPQ